MIASTDAIANTPASNANSAPRTQSQLLETVSASRLGTWLGCRLKFYFRYVESLSKPNTPARHVGTVVHAVLQQWNLARWRRAPLNPEAVLSVFEKAWIPEPEKPISWEEDEPEETFKSTALGLVRMYLKETPVPEDERPEGVEVHMEKDLSAHGLPTLIGIIDLIGRIVDFKTSGQMPNTEKALHTHELRG